MSALYSQRKKANPPHLHSEVKASR